MKSISLSTRLVAGFLLAIVVAVIAVAVFNYQKIKSHLVALQIQNLVLEGNANKTEYYDLDKAIQLGADPKLAKEFFAKSDIDSIGLLAGSSNTGAILYLYRTGSDRVAGVYKSVGLAGLLGETWRGTLTLVGLIAILGTIFIYLYTTFALRPLNSLRSVTENILAGNFDFKVRYRSKDNLGTTFQALDRLCVELEKKEKALEAVSELATTDGMTGLKNHRAFKEEITRQILMCGRNKTNLGLILIDVDHFKKFNDTYGHQQGDEVLKTVGKTLLTAARKTDFVARYGGEEFVVVAPETNGDGIRNLCEKLRAAIETAKVENLGQPNQALSVTASFGGLSIDGASLKSEQDKDYRPFVEICDKNLYSSKKSGRNQSTVSEIG